MKGAGKCARNEAHKWAQCVGTKCSGTVKHSLDWVCTVNRCDMKSITHKHRTRRAVVERLRSIQRPRPGADVHGRPASLSGGRRPPRPLRLLRAPRYASALLLSTSGAWKSLPSLGLNARNSPHFCSPASTRSSLPRQLATTCKNGACRVYS